MPDPRFFETQAPLSVKDAVSLAGGAMVAGDETAMLSHVAAPDEASLTNAVVYCADAAFLEALSDREFGLCLLSEKLADEKLAEGASVRGAIARIASPRLGFALIGDRLHRSIEKSEPGLRSDMPDGADIDETAVISRSADLGAGLRIGAHVTIGPGVVLGDGCVIEAGVSITHALIGEETRILAGARIGQAGFGFVESAGGLVRVPQLGRVVIEGKVEIGANTCIDRGALGDTIIGRGTKIDNLVQIGHNTRIGKYCVIAGQTGIAGSCIIGDGVFMGGRVGLVDHLTIGDGVQIAAGSGLMRNVPAGEKLAGSPAKPVKDWLREIATLAKLARKKNG